MKTKLSLLLVCLCSLVCAQDIGDYFLFKSDTWATTTYPNGRQEIYQAHDVDYSRSLYEVMTSYYKIVNDPTTAAQVGYSAVSKSCTWVPLSFTPARFRYTEQWQWIGVATNGTYPPMTLNITNNFCPTPNVNPNVGHSITTNEITCAVTDYRCSVYFRRNDIVSNVTTIHAQNEEATETFDIKQFMNYGGGAGINGIGYGEVNGVLSVVGWTRRAMNTGDE